MPIIPNTSLEEYRNAELTKIADDRILPESKVFDLGFAFKS